MSLPIKTVVLATCTLIVAAVAASDSDNGYRSLKGTYRVYSGELGEQLAPTASDRKISIILTGAVAKEMFESMGPDDKDVCATAPGDRSRAKKNVWCTYTRADGYVCYFGFDLRSGSSIPGGIC